MKYFMELAFCVIFQVDDESSPQEGNEQEVFWEGVRNTIAYKTLYINIYIYIYLYIYNIYTLYI